jgi:hypothetical protein
VCQADAQLAHIAEHSPAGDLTGFLHGQHVPWVARSRTPGGSPSSGCASKCKKTILRSTTDACCCNLFQRRLDEPIKLGHDT